jgi:hypothetical protein
MTFSYVKLGSKSQFKTDPKTQQKLGSNWGQDLKCNNVNVCTNATNRVKWGFYGISRG